MSKFPSFKLTGLITSDFVRVKTRGPNYNKRGHVVKINVDTVDILLKNTDGIVITVGKDEIVLKQRMFLRTKDMRQTPEEKILLDFKNLNINPGVSELIDSLVI